MYRSTPPIFISKNYANMTLWLFPHNMEEYLFTFEQTLSVFAQV